MIPAEGSSEHPESCPKTHRQISGSLPPLSEAQEALPLLQCHPGEKETMWKTEQLPKRDYFKLKKVIEN